ncbi:hypothetical protein J0A67_17365 [Algoriphagus aestuariicola]|uniref:Uncharacterized protein n=1 Tax=Algoriphagus aestuariicola TaxID=1852016 RepID=A0ABS3BY51_9BACT|nr:hypothetical protein [Algoriphagus aestuariicola]MBN7802649.1 hypothetical protein [Algoriphagus aestuariicola]
MLPRSDLVPWLSIECAVYADFADWEGNGSVQFAVSGRQSDAACLVSDRAKSRSV